MSGSREKLIEAAASDSPDDFLQLMRAHSSRDDPFDVGELLASFTRKQFDELWTHLQIMSSRTLLSFNVDLGDTLQQKELEAAALLIQSIVTVATETILQDVVYVPRQLLETAVVLHAILPSLPEELCKLQLHIAGLCETWWIRDVEGKQELVIEAITFFLQRTVRPKGTLADVKRVNRLRSGLEAVDIMAASSDTLRGLLLQTVSIHVYLRCDEGRRFLSFLFGLSVDFISQLHDRIKTQIPVCSKMALEWYGDVYFKAWRMAVGPSLERLEVGCIQDLMYHAIHAARRSSRSLASSLRKLLGVFHNQKRQQGVDQMLQRLYEPILWRSLNVSNGDIRANAATLFIDAFPILDPDANVVDVDSSMQKQFDELQRLLQDSSVTVRCVAIQGVCRICNVFWELIPAKVIQTLLLTLVRELAWDSSSADVRQAVLRGITHLFDNVLSHPSMKTLLPELRNLLHDTSEKVRIAFVEMLLKAKGIRTFKFWVIAPIEHLLARLEIDTPPVARRIATLLFSSYMPLDKGVDVQVTRCISLIEGNRGAARTFYQYAQRHMTLADVVGFMSAVCCSLLICVRKEAPQNGDTPEQDILETFNDQGAEKENQSQGDSSQGDSNQSDSSQGDSNQGDSNEGDSNQGDSSSASTRGDNEEESNVLSVEETNVLIGLLDTVVILWCSILPQLEKEANSDMKKKLQKRFSYSLPELFRALDHPEMTSSLIMLAGFLPPSIIPTVSRRMLSKLRGLSSDSIPNDYGTVLESMCKWGKIGDVLELISDWLADSLVAEDGSNSQAPSGGAKTQKTGRSVMFSEPSSPKPQLGLDYVSYLVKHSACREILLKCKRAELCEVVGHLDAVLFRLQQRLDGQEPPSEECSDELLLNTFDVLYKLKVILRDPEDENHNVLAAFQRQLAWLDIHAGTQLRRNKQPKRRHRRLLNAADATLLIEPSGDTTQLSQTLPQASDMMSQTMMSQTLLSQTLMSQTLLSETLIGQKRPADDERQDLAVQLIVRALTLASNMLLVGIGDQALMSRLADFAAQLLLLDDGVPFLPQVVQLTYQITELSCSFCMDPPDGDTGTGCHGDVVPNMLEKIMQMLAKLSRNKREIAERVLPGIKSAFGEILISYYRHHSLNQTVNKGVMATIAMATVTEMTYELKKDVEYEARLSASELPPLSAFLLALLVRRTLILGVYLDEINTFINSGAICDVHTLCASLHLVNVIVKGNCRSGEVKECLTSLQEKLGSYETRDGDNDDQTLVNRTLYTSGVTLLKECMTRVGMVA